MRDTDALDALAISRSLADPASFGPVFDRPFATIYRYLRRRVGSELAQELAAETFLQAFRARRRFAGAGDSRAPAIRRFPFYTASRRICCA